MTPLAAYEHHHWSEDIKHNQIYISLLQATCLGFCGNPLSDSKKYRKKEFYTRVNVHRNKFLFNIINRRTNFPNLFWLKKMTSTCFGQFLCPSSGVR
jgi:hypothetical protein